MTEPTVLLDELLTAVGPFVLEAARSTSEPASRATGMVRIYPSPLRLDVVYHDGAAGHERVWRADGTEELAKLIARFLAAGVNNLPEPKRSKVQRVVAGGSMQAIAIVDVENGAASGVLVGSDENSTLLAPDILFTLCQPPVEH